MGNVEEIRGQCSAQFRNPKQDLLHEAVQELMQSKHEGRVGTCIMIWTEDRNIRNYWFAKHGCLEAYGLLDRMKRTIDAFVERGED